MDRQEDGRQSNAKVRIDFTDSTGAKYSVSIERASKDSIGKLMDFVDSISTSQQMVNDGPIDTNFARVYELVQTKLKFGSFNSNDVLQAYEHEFHLPSSLSIISTYLARLANRGLLVRHRSGLGWVYRVPAKPEGVSLVVGELQPGSSTIPR